MMKIVAIMAVLILAGCTPTAENITANFAPPEELKDCTFHHMRSSNGGNITVVRCPNSSVTTKTGGKNARTTVVIDGIEYEKVK